MFAALRDFKKLVFRRLLYTLGRSNAPAHPKPFSGPVLVVGSAPVARLPAGFDKSFSIITVNGAQSTTKKWGIDAPDVTFIQNNQINGVNTNAVSIRRVLNGERTGRLYIVMWKNGRRELEDRLSAMNYGYESLMLVGRNEKIALHESVLGQINVESNKNTQFSNGITAVLYALHSGAKAVIISGINPMSTGHAYNDANLARQHSQRDRDILMAIHNKGFPLYTADIEVARSIGLPLWASETRDGEVPQL